MQTIRKILVKAINEEIQLQRKWNDEWNDLTVEGACRVMCSYSLDLEFNSYTAPNIRIKPEVVTTYKFTVEESKRIQLCNELMEVLSDYGATVERSTDVV